MAQFHRLSGSQLSVGMCFSAPLFFDDGKNMFLAQGKAVKPYHIAALSRWKIDSLLTYGRPVSDSDRVPGAGTGAETPDDIEELDDLEEMEPAD